jgi:hypothetical protein
MAVISFVVQAQQYKREIAPICETGLSLPRTKQLHSLKWVDCGASMAEQPCQANQVTKF